MMSTYIVTGGSGFIGSHLCQRLLELGHRIINIDNFSDFYHYKVKIKNSLESKKYQGDFKYKEKETDLQRLISMVNSESYKLEVVDIRNYQEIDKVFQQEKVDAVIHLAALAGVRPSIENPLAYTDVNIQGTMVILEMMRKHGVAKLIFASSSSVYGNNQKVPFSEGDFVDRTISPYAATKKSGEMIVHTYFHLYNISTIILRFFTVYGPRQRPDLAIHKFTKMITEDVPIPVFGDGRTRRDYTYIDDIVDGIVNAIGYIENNHLFEVFNLGESRTISLQKMITTIEQTLGKKATKKFLPLQPGDVLQTYANIEKAKRLIGYNPQTTFEEGIKQFITWYKGEKT